MSGLELFSAGALERMLDKTAQGSAEQRAIQKELRRRELEYVEKRDSKTPTLFTGTEWERTKR